MTLRGSLVGTVSCLTSIKETWFLSHSFCNFILNFSLILQNGSTLLSNHFSENLCFCLSLKPFIWFWKLTLNSAKFWYPSRFSYWHSKFPSREIDLYPNQNNFSEIRKYKRIVDLSFNCLDNSLPSWSFFFLTHDDFTGDLDFTNGSKSFCCRVCLWCRVGRLSLEIGLVHVLDTVKYMGTKVSLDVYLLECCLFSAVLFSVVYFPLFSQQHLKYAIIT